ncbi:hypothetical protein B9Z65_5616 [Elsinoe australis]|uniref:Uncharacterized protein n=1 Tax=Elsinoe australis TaxID=40998 RepID=A0A2P7Z3B7_9PEZI|nr:hypothetical protein B9Z65_5616 [Elsinoe australis]
MFPADCLPACYIEEREMEIRAARARKLELERAARAFGQPQSACSTPMASPNPGLGFFSGFFSAFTRSADSTPTTNMSRSTSSSGAVCGSASTSAATGNNNKTT